MAWVVRGWCVQRSYSAVNRRAREEGPLQVVPYAVHPTPGKLAHYAGLGIEEVVVQLPPAGRRRC